MILDKLPLEIILNISSLLVLEDKLILITTCRRLFNLISNTTLFSELDLLSRGEKVQQDIKHFTGSRYPGSQVKRLSIDITKIPDQLMLQLPTIFPNITEFRTHIWNDRMRSRGSYFTDTVLQWSNTLEIYDIRCDWIEILPVLKTTVFPRLTALFLGYSYNREDKNEGFDIAYFIPHIKNAPALRELTLDSCALDLDFLEQIHTSCPLLRSLKLYSTSIVIKQDKLFQPIIPTSSLVYLEIEQPFCFDTNGLLLDYITSKYRCLKELALSFELEYNTFPFDGYYSKVDISPFTDRDSESDEDDIHEPKIQEYIRIDRSLKKDFEESLVIYKKSGTRFFSNLTATVKSITIGNDIFGNALEALSRSDVRPVDLRYYDILETTDQMQYISHIKTLKTLTLNFHFPERVNMLIFPSTSITKLTLSIRGEHVCCDWLFLTFPSLEQLEIQGIGSWTTSDNCNHHCANMVPNLWKLQVSVKLMDQKCIDFLKMAAPNIQEVEIVASLIPTAHQVSIDISEWNLKQLGILIRDMTFMGSCYYRIKTPYLDEVIRYTPLHNSVALVKSRTHSLDTTALRMIDIIASDNSHFTFFGCRISLTQSKITLTSSN